MFKHFAKYFATGQLSFEDGFIHIVGQRMLFIPDEVTVGVQRCLQEKFGEQEGSYLLYSMFREGGKLIPDAVRTHVNLKGFEIIKWMKDTATGGGWGHLELISSDDQHKRAIFSIGKSPFPPYFKPPHPVCNTTRGLIAGTLSAVYKREIEGVERECAVTGAKKCLMLFQPRNEWLDAGTELMEKVRWQLPNLFV